MNFFVLGRLELCQQYSMTFAHLLWVQTLSTSTAELGWSGWIGVAFALWLIWRWLVRPAFVDSDIFRYKPTPTAQQQAMVVVVTGCDTGFGRNIALRMHALGATVFAGCLNPDSFALLRADAAKQCAAGSVEEKSAQRMRPVLLDVTQDAHVEAVLQAVRETGLVVRALVNNAGISAFGWAELLPVRSYQANLDVNVLGTVRMTKAFLPLLRASRGRIVNMGSVGARMPSAFGSAYLLTKAAMVSYSECVRQEVHRFGVRVCCVEPGFFATNLLQAASTQGKLALQTNNDPIRSSSSRSSSRNAKSSGNANTKTAAAAGVVEQSSSRGQGREQFEAAATEHVHAVYPEYAKKMSETAQLIRTVEWLNGGPRGVDAVTDCVVDAVCNRFPLTQYTVGYDARLTRHVLRFLPAWLIDFAQTHGL